MDVITHRCSSDLHCVELRAVGFKHFMLRVYGLGFRVARGV